MRIAWFALALACATTSLRAAEVVIVNVNAPGVGLNDPAPAIPAAGANGASTLGQQRLRVVQRAAEIWGAVLDSSVPIRIEVEMVDLPCESGNTILGQGGPTYLAWNFANAPRRDTAYPIALANALARTDLHSGADIAIDLNRAVDSGCSGTSVGWWYGLDPDAAVPSDRIALLPVMLHEIGHGLGFLSGVNPTTGAYVVSQPVLWSNFLYDQQMGKHWRAMSVAERAASARNDPFLVWTGEHVNSQLPNWLVGQMGLAVRGIRGGEQRVPVVAAAEFGDPLPGNGIEAGVVVVNDGAIAAGNPPGTLSDGCEYPFANGRRLDGRIALIDRGHCTFVEKALNAQRHGAVAVLIANNVDGPAPVMGGQSPDVDIPVLGITRDEAGRLRRVAPGLLRVQPERSATLSATREGCMRMYAPAEVTGGSSVVHFHSEATPALLMEPSVSRGLGDQLDLTLDLFRDLGWTLRVGSPPPAANNCFQRPLP